MFFQYAAEAGNLCRHFFRPPGLCSHDIHPPDPQGRPSGYATIVVLLCFMFAMMFIIIGIIGEYIAILFTELKDRPIYIVDRTENFEERP